MFLTGVLQKTLESPLDCKELQPVNPKENQSWIFLGRTDAEAPILWPPDAKNCLIWKDPDAEKDWGWEEKGTTEDEMVGWHHWLCGHEFEQAPGVGDGQGGLLCCCIGSQRVRQDWASELNWTELNWTRLLMGVHLPLGMTLTGVDPRDQRCDSKKVRWKGSQQKHPVLMSRLSLVICSSLTRTCTPPHSVCLRNVQTLGEDSWTSSASSSVPLGLDGAHCHGQRMPSCRRLQIFEYKSFSEIEGGVPAASTTRNGAGQHVHVTGFRPCRPI